MARLSPYELGNVAAFVYETAKGLTERMCEDRPVRTGAPAEVATAMEAALDEVATQIVSMPLCELVEEEELEWSFDAPGGWSLFVEGERGEPTEGVLPVLLTVHARQFFQHDKLARAVTAPLDG